MANFSSSKALLVHPFALLLIFLLVTSNAQLSTNYYTSSCPALLPIVRSVVESAVAKEPRIGASLLRLFFHDCFVNVRTYIAQIVVYRFILFSQLVHILEKGKGQLAHACHQIKKHVCFYETIPKTLTWFHYFQFIQQ